LLFPTVSAPFGGGEHRSGSHTIFGYEALKQPIPGVGVEFIAFTHCTGVREVAVAIAGSACIARRFATRIPKQSFVVNLSILKLTHSVISHKVFTPSTCF
jgi:hypothetical protein